MIHRSRHRQSGRTTSAVEILRPHSSPVFFQQVMVIGFVSHEKRPSGANNERRPRKILGSVLEYRTLAVLDTLRDLQLYNSQNFAGILLSATCLHFQAEFLDLNDHLWNVLPQVYWDACLTNQILMWSNLNCCQKNQRHELAWLYWNMISLGKRQKKRNRSADDLQKYTPLLRSIFWVSWGVGSLDISSRNLAGSTSS